VATGASSLIPRIEGLDSINYYTNATIFNINSLPKEMVILGGGPIGCEMAQAFARFGSKVTIVFNSDFLLPREDPDISKCIEDVFISEGITLKKNSEIFKVNPAEDDSNKIENEFRKIEIKISSGNSEETIFADLLLLACGRKPNTEKLSLENAKIQHTSKGISINEYMQTSNPNVYAIGDVCSVHQFTHSADFMARKAIRNALFFGREKWTSMLVPRCTFTDPEVAHVGQSESQLKRDNIAYDVYQRDYCHVDRAILDSETCGFVKIMCRKDTAEILGGSIIGVHAGDQISQLTLLITHSVPLSSLSSTMYPYPTRSECIRQLGDAYLRRSLTPIVRMLLRWVSASRRWIVALVGRGGR
jgi:pyruvate/2-oxoglutarate dehydrogenase complex dihydrolipoamide dehydrogenase (E3) component